jgi:hypothetical protein
MNSHLSPMIVAGPAAVFGDPTRYVVAGIPAPQ